MFVRAITLLYLLSHFTLVLGTAFSNYVAIQHDTTHCTVNSAFSWTFTFNLCCSVISRELWPANIISFFKKIPKDSTVKNLSVSIVTQLHLTRPIVSQISTVASPFCREISRKTAHQETSPRWRYQSLNRTTFPCPRNLSFNRGVLA